MVEGSCVCDVLCNHWTIGTVILLLSVKIYLKLSCGACKSDRRLDGKTVIVTGANTGIGKETARDLARRGARVILACRNVDKANTARDEIVASTGNQDVLVRKLDLASLSSVREFSKHILESEPRLDVLINNAGVAGIDKIMTEDNLVLGMQANHFAPFLLTNLLAVSTSTDPPSDTSTSPPSDTSTGLPSDTPIGPPFDTSIGLLRDSAPSRIVNVSSLLHKYCKLDLENLNCEKSFNKTDVYSVSKLNNILMTSELSRRLKGTGKCDYVEHASGVTANSLHPGVIKTEIMRQMPALMLAVTNFFMGIFAKDAVEGAQTTSRRTPWKELRPPLEGLGASDLVTTCCLFQDAVEGAQTTIYLAVSEEVEGLTGKYFADCKEVTPSAAARDEGLAKKLWEKTEELVKLKPQEMRL
uniref:Retinol dehydrogenase 14 n=1 Tax=Timema tahoe TaxID=61484 RepID=A0A7R9FED8_9NEOP|nr:unnamed protein product [Timema tahoe]